TLQKCASDLAGVMQHSHAELQQALESRDQQRLERWTEAFGAMTEQAQAQARDTIAEISRLVDAASEAPRAAAEVVAGLRQKLSESMVRDTAMLAERTQTMETLATLLGAVDQASGQPRGAIAAPGSTSAQLLEEAGTRFGAQVEAGSGAIAAAVARVDAHAEGASRLGEALSLAVEQLGERNAQLAERLDAITAALEAAGARGDEQLAYYVAQ